MCPRGHAAVGRQLLGNLFPSSKHVECETTSRHHNFFRLESKAIYFVLAFPQADLDMDIWMYLLRGFRVDGETEEDPERSYILKLNKSMYELKQASYNWYEKQKTGLQDRGFTPS